MGLVRVGLCFALAACGCSEERAAPPPTPVAAPANAPAPTGTMVTLDAHRMELHAHRSGEVFATLGRVDEQPVASPESALVTVTLTIDEDHPRPTLLRWNAAEARYEARLRSEPLEGPADVQLMIGGAVERGSVDRLPIEDALVESGVAYAEAEEGLDDEDEEEPEDDVEEPAGSGGGGGGIRARARRLFGF